MPQTIAQSARRLPLIHGPEIPQIGLGTWLLEGEDCLESVGEALAMGYRHVDTAEVYGNEEEVGRALRDSDVAREDVFLTSKVARQNLHRDGLLPACHASLERLGTDYLDLYLVHWPNRDVPIAETVEAMEELLEQGRIRSWGVSNFTITHLQETLEHGRPSLNQVELHPRLQQPDLVRFCRENDIVVTAYSPLARGGVLDTRTLADVGRSYDKSPAQVALRWSLEEDRVVIPKASGRQHLAENADVFDFSLTDRDMERIRELDEGERLLDPEWAEFDHSA